MVFCACVCVCVCLQRAAIVLSKPDAARVKEQHTGERDGGGGGGDSN